MAVKPGYKQTEVGVIPEDWLCETLENLSAFITKGSTPTTYGYQWEQSGVLFLRSECVSERGLDLTQSMFISPAAHASLRRSEVYDGDILVTITGYVGRVVYLLNIGRANLNQHIARVRIVSAQVDPRYAYFYLSQISVRRYFNTITTGQAYPQISLKQVRETVIPFPPIKAEQEAIAEALFDADALIESLEQLIAKKSQIKQGAMQELLTAKTRLPGFSGEWSVICMRDALVQNATYGIVTAGAFVQNGVKMLRGGDIVDGRIDTDLPMVSREKAAEYGRTALMKNDVVIALVGYPGAAAKIPDELIGANISRAVGLLRVNSKVTPDYLVCFLNSPTGRRMVLAPSAGSAQQVVNLAALNKLEFAIPERKEQTAIATILSDMDTELAALETKLAKARQLKQGMMQELLTGRVRLVSPAIAA